MSIPKPRDTEHDPLGPSTMDRIEHVVVLMLENRSFDSLLGWLYEKDQPAHHVPDLKPNERPFDGLQGLDLLTYTNESNTLFKHSLELTLRGVLSAGGWTRGNILREDELKQRRAVVEQLLVHSNQSVHSLQSKSDDELIGMAGAIIYLLGHGDRNVERLQKMSTEDHRNTLITVLHGLAPKESVRSLQGKTTKALVEQATRDQAWVRLRVAPIRGANALNAPNFSPGESFDEVARQHHGTDGKPGASPDMKGYVRDYVHVLKHDRGCSDEQIVDYADQVMRSFTPAQLPVLNGLAKHYAVCDAWFSSVPSQTNSNRAFAFCGTSHGLVDNGFLETDKRAEPIEKFVGYKLGDDRFVAPTIFNALADSGADWNVYYRSGMLQDNIMKLVDAYLGHAGPAAALSFVGASGAFLTLAELIAAFYLLAKGVDLESLKYLRGLSDSTVDSSYSYRLFPALTKLPDAAAKFKKFEKFEKDARDGKLPHLTFIEPAWSISPQSCGSAFGPNILYHLGDDYHPPSNLDGGENLLKGVYESLTANAEAWNKTLLVVTFDEPVGSFDHVPPPAAFPPWEKGQAPARLEKGFAFDRLGGRVPTLLVSPLIDKGTVFRSETGIPYDHTSLIATLLKWRGQKQKLANFGKRAQNAPTFENVITRREPRTDALDVPFLKGRKIGDTVRYLDRFRLCNEHGTYVSTFSEEFAEWALFSAPFAQDSAIKEYFPTVGAESKKASLLYFVNPDHRADDGEIVRHVGREDSRNPSSRVKLIGQDKGLGSYNVLGVWKDSRSCYYSHDYTEGDNDQKERWLISQAVRDHEFREDRRLRYGQRVTIQSQLYPEWFLAPDGRFLKTTREDLTWTLLPANLRWSASATNDQRGEWQAPVFSPDGEPLLGLAALKDDGYGIVNLRGIAGDYGIHGTPWTSDDCPSVPLLSKHSPNVRDQIAAVHLRTQGDYGIVDLSFETKKGFHSDWFTKNRDFTKLVSIRVPSDAVLVGLIGRKWAKHGLMDVQLAYQ